MKTSSNGNIFRVTGPLCGEFTGHGEFPAQRPVTRSFDVFFDLSLNKRLCKQSRRWWFETPLRSLWCHSNVIQNCHETISNGFNRKLLLKMCHFLVIHWSQSRSCRHGLVKIVSHSGYSRWIFVLQWSHICLEIVTVVGYSSWNGHKTVIQSSQWLRIRLGMVTRLSVIVTFGE